MRPDTENLGARFYAYELVGGWKVFAGRTEDDNDLLSTTFAHPDDWWFHAGSGVPGSHVILRARPDGDPPREILRQAAAIAAYHSKARAASNVPVSCTRARYVTKPRRAKPGLVQIEHETTYKVRPMTPHPARTARVSDLENE
ncbi:MAG TPA: NFACT RNA binding domain-containing protein [Candidatus Binataceae bacterium]|nr:NFACT RNA binding domain-containing protein [Candidatus Binataceae bacterium]